MAIFHHLYLHRQCLGLLADLVSFLEVEITLSQPRLRLSDMSRSRCISSGAIVTVLRSLVHRRPVLVVCEHRYCGWKYLELG